jgi:hypothetical protein
MYVEFYLNLVRSITSELKEESAELSSLSLAALITVQFDTTLGSSAASNAKITDHMPRGSLQEECEWI